MTSLSACFRACALSVQVVIESLTPNGPRRISACPDRYKWTALEDNDPTGFRPKPGMAGKAEAGIKVLQIPKHCPQFNMCDYALWKAVEKRMRSQEKRFARSFSESRAAFLRRLRRTATRLTSVFINNTIKNMKIRCQRLVAARGGHIEEGR